MKTNGAYSLPYIIKAEWTSSLLFLILLGPIVILFLHLSFKSLSALPGFILSLSVLSGVLVWLRSFKITILEGEVIYDTLFSKNNRMAFTDIKKLEISIGASNRKAGFVRFNVCSGAGMIAINMKPFGKHDLAVLADVLASRAPGAKTDEMVEELRRGNFSPVASATAKKIWQVSWSIFLMFFIIALIHGLTKR